jgi:predicted GIY-YIG superfamily endonuclease
MWRPVKAPPNSGIMGWIYLLHFDQAYGHAGHYTGWTGDLPGRLRDHEAGRGSNLCRKASAAGVSWVLASVVPGDRNEERRIKNLGGAAKRCPVCHGHQPDIDRQAARLLTGDTAGLAAA